MQFQGDFSQNKNIFCNSIRYKAQCLFGETMDVHPRGKNQPRTFHAHLAELCLCHHNPPPCASPFCENTRDLLSSCKPQSHVLADSTHQTYEKELTAITILYVTSWLQNPAYGSNPSFKPCFFLTIYRQIQCVYFPYVTLSSAALDLQAISCFAC